MAGLTMATTIPCGSDPSVIANTMSTFSKDYNASVNAPGGADALPNADPPASVAIVSNDLLSS